MKTPAPADCQPELNLRTRAAANDPVAAEGIAELCGLLRGRGWLTAKQLVALRPAWTERSIRKLASASGGQVISGPGTPGYCHHEDASTEELEHAGNQQISQGRAMWRRGIDFKRMARFRRLAQPKGNPALN